MSRRISVSIAFWLLTGTGLTAVAAIELLNDAIGEPGKRGPLQLWRDGVAVSADHFRRHYIIGRYPGLPYFAVVVVPKGGAGPTPLPVFELDTDQIVALIAKLKVKPKRPGRPRKQVDAAAIAAAREKRLAENKPATQAKIAQDLSVSKSTLHRRTPPKK